MAKKKFKSYEATRDRFLDLIGTYRGDMDKLQIEQRNAMDTYMGDPPDYVKDDDLSQFISSDIADTVNWILPSLIRIFFGGPQVAEFSPVGPEDEEKAPLIEQLVNHQFNRQNKGFLICHDWFFDACLMKIGLVAYEWKVETKKTKKEWEGLTEDEFILLKADPGYEIDNASVEIEEVTPATYADGEFGETVLIAPAVSTYSCSGYKVRYREYPKLSNVKQEDVLYDIHATSIAESEVVCRRLKWHKNKLKQFGLSDYQIGKTYERWGDYHTDPMVQARFKDLGGLSFLGESKESSHVFVHEVWGYDYDAKGERIPIKMLLYGDEVLEVQDNTLPGGHAPICDISPMRVSHRLVGMSFYDILKDLQKLRSYLIRAILNNSYFNTGRTVVNPFRVNVDDYTSTNRPDALVRTKQDIDPSSGIYVTPVQQLPQHTYELAMQGVSQWRDDRSGVNKMVTGGPTGSNRTATGISTMMSAAYGRIELVARIIAETGMRDLLQAIVDMDIEFMSRPALIKFNDEWRTITPEQIDGEFDITIDIGPMTGSKETQVNQMIQMVQYSMPGIQLGVYSPTNFANHLKEIYRLWGYRNSEKFVTDPAETQGYAGLPPQLINAIFEQLKGAGIQIDGLIATLQQQLTNNQAGAPGAGPAFDPRGQGLTNDYSDRANVLPGNAGMDQEPVGEYAGGGFGGA